MRIIAGKLRHRIIKMTNLETTRETQDKVRGAIFNMIGPYLDFNNCLDLFAGSGAMGLEAYSRGVRNIYLNDSNFEAIKIIEENSKSLNVDAKIYNLDYLEFIKKIEIKFDLIILDPPYKMDNIEEILDSILPILAESGIIVFEMKKESKYPESFNRLKLIKNKEYGIKRVVVYEY